MRLLTVFLTIFIASGEINPATATDLSGSNIIVTTQYAVPVGVPVAPYAPTYYSLQAINNENSVAQLSDIQEQKLVEKIADRVVQRLVTHPASGQSAVQAQEPVNSASLILQQRCINCHSQDNSKGSLNLNVAFPSMSRKTRQKAILRMLSSDPSRRMPKGQPPLSESEFLALFKAMVR